MSNHQVAYGLHLYYRVASGIHIDTRSWSAHQRRYGTQAEHLRVKPVMRMDATTPDAIVLAACRRNERRAQRCLYDRYSPVMYAIAIRYVRDVQVAQDVLAEAWAKAFTKLNTFAEQGSLEGWLKRIVTNESLMELRKKKLSFTELPDYGAAEECAETIVTTQLEQQAVNDLLDCLPEGCRTVYNLYEIEGYKHREIADLLSVSINTSKSQLILAKRKLREAYLQLAAREGHHVRPLPKDVNS